VPEENGKIDLQPPVSLPLRCFVGALSLLIGLGSILIAILAAIEAPKPIYVLLGSELVALVAAVIGVLFGLGRFREGPGMALLCVSGSWVAACGMAWLGTSPAHAVADFGLAPWVAGRGLAAGLVGLLACWVVLSRDPRALRMAAKGVLLGLPIVIVAGLVATGRTAPVVSAISGLPGAIRALIAILGFLLLAGLFAASVDTLVKAFSRGRRQTGG